MRAQACAGRAPGLNPYKLRTIMQHALVAHRPPPARSEPHGTFLMLTRVRGVLAGVGEFISLLGARARQSGRVHPTGRLEGPLNGGVNTLWKFTVTDGTWDNGPTECVHQGCEHTAVLAVAFVV